MLEAYWRGVAQQIAKLYSPWTGKSRSDAVSRSGTRRAHLVIHGHGQCSIGFRRAHSRKRGPGGACEQGRPPHDLPHSAHVYGQRRCSMRAGNWTPMHDSDTTPHSTPRALARAISLQRLLRCDMQLARKRIGPKATGPACR